MKAFYAKFLKQKFSPEEVVASQDLSHSLLMLGLLLLGLVSVIAQKYEKRWDYFGDKFVLLVAFEHDELYFS